MPKNIPSLKPRELIRLLEQGGCIFYREGKGDIVYIVVSLKTHVELFQLIWEPEKCHPLTCCEFLDNLAFLMKR